MYFPISMIIIDLSSYTVYWLSLYYCCNLYANFVVAEQVSVHNGWKFVSEPHIVYLEPEYEGGKSGRKTPSSQSSLRGTLIPLTQWLLNLYLHSAVVTSVRWAQLPFTSKVSSTVYLCRGVFYLVKATKHLYTVTFVQNCLEALQVICKYKSCSMTNSSWINVYVNYSFPGVAWTEPGWFETSIIISSYVFTFLGKILSLVLRSRLELNELVHHPLFAIIFELEYVMSEPFTQPLIETKRKKVSNCHRKYM